MEIFKELLKYKKSGISSFCTPGHKNNINIINKLCSLDYTESLPGFLELISHAEEKAREYYNTEVTLFSSQGCTLCIQAMLSLVLKSKDKIICDRNVHKSAVNAMALLDLNPIWIVPENNFNLPEKINLKELEEVLYKNPDIKAMYITSPNYFGIIQDIKNIKKICEKFKIVLLVDNAHGSHLFCAEPDLHPLNLGADICADSLHKTLPAISGAACLHVKNKNFKANAREFMQIFSSSTINMPVISSIDMCISLMKKNKEEVFKELKYKINKINFLSKNKNLFFLEKSCDPFRISLNVNQAGYTGKEFFDFLRENKIEPEYFNSSWVVLIPSIANSSADFARLESVINKLKFKREIKTEFKKLKKLPEVKLSLKESIFSEKVYKSLKDLNKKIAAEIIAPCPPGVPVIMPGEEINKEIIEILKSYGISGMKVVK